MRNIFLITDADNTLWDTNAVFAKAQHGLLKNVERAVGIKCEDYDRLAFVRRIDQKIATHDHRHLKYPPHMLVKGIAQQLGGVITYSDETIIVKKYFEALSATPQLRPGVRESLETLMIERVRVRIVTEGVRERVISTLVKHNLTKFAESVVSGHKTVELYSRLAKLDKNTARYCVGDQLDKDIAPAKESGYTTIYFPGAFVPDWTAQYNGSPPDFIINDYREVLRILRVQKDLARLPTNKIAISQ